MPLTVANLLDRLADLRRVTGEEALEVPVIIEETRRGARTVADGMYIDGNVDNEGNQQYAVIIRKYVLPTPQP